MLVASGKHVLVSSGALRRWWQQVSGGIGGLDQKHLAADGSASRQHTISSGAGSIVEQEETSPGYGVVSTAMPVVLPVAAASGFHALSTSSALYGSNCQPQSSAHPDAAQAAPLANSVFDDQSGSN